MSESDDPLAQQWQTLLAGWDEPERHAAFVALAAQLDRLRDAATFYRTIPESDERHAVAAKGLERIVARALAQIEALPHSRVSMLERGGQWAMPVATLLALITASFLLSRVMHSPRFVSPLVIAVEILVVVAIPWQRFRR